MVEKYHVVLRSGYKMIIDDLQGCKLNKEIILQLAIKVINDTTGPNNLVTTFLVFETYFRISEFDTSISTIS